MFYKDIKQVIEKQEIEQGNLISIILQNSAYNNKDSNILQLSKIEGTFERLDTQYFIYTPKGSEKKEYKVLNKVKSIEKITCQTKSL